MIIAYYPLWVVGYLRIWKGYGVKIWLVWLPNLAPLSFPQTSFSGKAKTIIKLFPNP